MALNRRDVIIGSIFALISWILTASWLPSVRFVPYALICGAVTALGLVAYVILTNSRALQDGPLYPPKSHSTTSLFITWPEVWTEETAALRQRQTYTKSQIRGLPASLSTSLEVVLDLIIRNYVKSWYSKLSTGDVFPNEIHSGICSAVGQLVRRLQDLDAVEVLVTRLLPIFNDHIEGFVEADRKVMGRDKARGLAGTEELDIAIAAKYRDGSLHPAASIAASRTTAPQQKHLRQTLERILPLIMPAEMMTSASVTVLVREIVACAVLLPTLQMLSDPDFLNQQIEAFGRSFLHDKRTVEMLRMALDKHASPPSKILTRSRRFPRLGPNDSQRTFERLIQAIRQCVDVAEARRLRNDIVSQVDTERVAGSANYIYLQRLEILHALLTQRIDQFPKPSSDTDGQIAPIGLEQSSLADWENATLRDVLYDAQGLSYFMEYMDQLGLVIYVQFWIMVDGFRNSRGDSAHPRNEKRSGNNGERQMLKRLSDGYLWKPELNVPVGAQKDVQQCVTLGERATSTQYEEARDAVLDAGSKIFQEMDHEHFPAFKQSQLYQKWLRPSMITGGPSRSAVSTPAIGMDSRSAQIVGQSTTPLRNPELRRAVASSSDLFSDAQDGKRPAESRRSLDDSAVRKPLFEDHNDDDDAPADRMVMSTQSLGSVDSGADLSHQSQAVDAVQAALDKIVDEKERDSEYIDGMQSERDSARSSLDIARGRERSPSPGKAKPSLASLGLVGRTPRRTVFTEDDLFGENEKLWEEDVPETQVNDDPASEIQEAAPGDLGLAEVIQELTIEINKLEAQLSVVTSLTSKAELVNNAAELRILRKSKASLDREIHKRELQRQRFIVQESDNNLYGKATVSIKSIMVGTEPDGHEFALYVVQIHRGGTDQVSGATWAIARRYSEFHVLHRRLRSRFPFVRNIEFPRRQVVLTLNKEFLRKRKVVLERYLRQLLTHPAICRSLELRAFLSQQAIQPIHRSGAGQVDRQDFVTRIYNSVTDGMDEFFGDMPALQQLSLAGQNLISAASTASTSTSTGGSTTPVNGPHLDVPANPNYMPGAIADDPKTAAEAQAEISAFETSPADGNNTPKYDSHRSSRHTTFIAPITTAFVTVFQLNTGNAWLRGRAIVVVLQQLLGGTIERKVRDTCRSVLLSPDALSRNVDLLKETMWPGGNARAAPLTRSTRQKERSRKEAGIILEALFEDAAGAVVGRNGAKDAGKRMARLLGNERLNAHLAFTLLDEIVEVVFGLSASRE